MEIDTRIVDDKVILTLRGPVTGAELKDAVEDLMRRGYRQFILDLRDVGSLDSEGLGAIVRAYTSVSRQGGTLQLRNLTKRLRDLRSITKLLEPPSFPNRWPHGADADQNAKARFLLWCIGLLILLMLLWNVIGRNVRP